MMTDRQVKFALMSLLISGGMLIPGNIPNIISASKLDIKSGEWAPPCFGGALMLLFYFNDAAGSKEKEHGMEMEHYHRAFKIRA